MQSVTIGNPDAYLRLTAAPSPGEHLPGGHLPGGHLPGGHLSGGHLPGAHLSGGHLPGGHLPRGFLKASLHTEEVTATRVLDLRRDHAGLAQFFDNAANQLDGPMVWGTRTELELTFQRARPDYLVLSITLQNRGWHQRAWTLETARDDPHQPTRTTSPRPQIPYRLGPADRSPPAGTPCTEPGCQRHVLEMTQMRDVRKGAPVSIEEITIPDPGRRRANADKRLGPAATTLAGCRRPDGPAM